MSKFFGNIIYPFSIYCVYAGRIHAIALYLIPSPSAGLTLAVIPASSHHSRRFNSRGYPREPPITLAGSTLAVIPASPHHSRWFNSRGYPREPPITLAGLTLAVIPASLPCAHYLPPQRLKVKS